MQIVSLSAATYKNINGLTMIPDSLAAGNGRVARSPVFYGISCISVYHFTICPMPFCMKITIFFEYPVFSTSESGNPR